MGKSICGATIAVALQPQMQPDQVVIIMSPPHLVEKWEREVKQAARRVFVRILKNVDDTRAFMDAAARQSTDTLKIGIISRASAKLVETSPGKRFSGITTLGASMILGDHCCHSNLLLTPG